jgi:hypothetical protein
MVPNLLYFEDTSDPKDFDRISSAIRKFYFKDEKITLGNLKNLSNIYSDRFFLNGIVQGAKIIAKHNIPVYAYVVDHKHANYSSAMFAFNGVHKPNGS